MKNFSLWLMQLDVTSTHRKERVKVVLNHYGRRIVINYSSDSHTWIPPWHRKKSLATIFTLLKCLCNPSKTIDGFLTGIFLFFLSINSNCERLIFWRIVLGKPDDESCDFDVTFVSFSLCGRLHLYLLRSKWEPHALHLKLCPMNNAFESIFSLFCLISRTHWSRWHLWIRIDCWTTHDWNTIID